MKTGERFTVEAYDSKAVYQVVRVDVDIVRCKDVYTDKEHNFRIRECKKTLKNPVILTETYNRDWCSNIKRALDMTKIKYRTVKQERMPGMTKFFVDSKKLSQARKHIDDFYKKGLDKQPAKCELETEVEEHHDENWDY